MKMMPQTFSSTEFHLDFLLLRKSSHFAMLEDFLSAIIAQIKISRFFNSIPFKWNLKTRRLIEDTNKLYNFNYKIGRFVHATYATFMATSFTHMWLTSDTKGGISVDQILSIGWICCHCGSGILSAGVAHKMDQLLRLINSFLEFEEKLCEGVLKILIKFLI